ncbi:Sec 66 endoplasmic reticulum translocation complex [Spraguea lophii 42_110]|uniref:Sec 66 endoplasmic reticulum translocation complex n=1 Tax=Spraguea lophii (strain 42_110) TaxID=1358809 RepID=S7WA58_SPRLO|nr:Sec 66 endoplasmic reticulum translocation complex [Spraguea lophii 42_110]
MIEALIICISVLIITGTFFAKGRNKDKSGECSEELEKYYSLLEDKVPTQILYKQLILCAKRITEEANNIEDEKEKMYYLYMDRLISESWWSELKDRMKVLKNEKILIYGEAESIQQGFGEKIFELSKKLQEKKKSTKHHKDDDIFYKKKKEALERELYKKMCLQRGVTIK